MSAQEHIVSPRPRLRARGLDAFTRRLAVAVQYGGPVADALDALAADPVHKRFAPIVADLRRQMAAGASFSEALQHHPKVFSALYVRAVAAGEKRGALAEALRLLHEHMMQAKRLRAKRRRGMWSLGAVVIAVALVVAAIVSRIYVTALLYPTPWFKEPAKEHALVFFCGAAIAALAVWGVKSSRFGAYVFDCVRLVLPIVRPLHLNAAIARFSHALGLLLSCGVPATESLELASAETASPVLRGQLALAADHLAGGASISESLAAGNESSRLFKRPFLWVVSAGDEGATTPRALMALAAAHEQELSRKAWLAGAYGLVALVYLVWQGYGVVVGAGIAAVVPW